MSRTSKNTFCQKTGFWKFNNQSQKQFLNLGENTNEKDKFKIRFVRYESQFV
jgi:hypothetical protein